MKSNVIQTDTLEVLAMAPRYNQWILDSFQDAIGNRVLEIGCGIGTFTQMLLNHNAHHVTAVDIIPEYVERVQELEAPSGKSLEAKCVNLFTEDLSRLKDEIGTFDTIVMLNVLEHIQDDEEALRILRELLNPSGSIVLLVPSLSFLYSDYDRSIHHYRRYHKSSLRQAIESGDLRVDMLKYFNFAGIFGWWLNFCVQKKLEMNPGSVSVFNTICPMVRAVETVLPPPIGLSLLAVAKKAG